MKRLSCFVLLFLIYFLLMIGPMFLGYLSPTLWFFYPVLSALVAATPLMMAAKERKDFGGVMMFPLFWYLLLLVMGELSFPERILSPLVLVLMAEGIRIVFGYDQQNGLRWAYAVSSLVTAMQHLIIFTRTEFYYQGALEEMGDEAYAYGIIGFAKPAYFVLLVGFTLLAGYCGALLSEKLFGEKVKLSD